MRHGSLLLPFPSPPQSSVFVCGFAFTCLGPGCLSLRNPRIHGPDPWLLQCSTKPRYDRRATETQQHRLAVRAYIPPACIGVITGHASRGCRWALVHAGHNPPSPGRVSRPAHHVTAVLQGSLRSGGRSEVIPILGVLIRCYRHMLRSPVFFLHRGGSLSRGHPGNENVRHKYYARAFF